MIGQLIWTGSRRPGVQLREGEVAGLRVLQAQLPGNGASRRAERIWIRALSLLERHGANQLLTPTNSAFPIQRRIVTRELWRSAAIPLALDTLDRAGQRRSRAVVGMSARQVTPQLLQWCRLLAAQVRGLSLDLDTGRDALEWQLQRELGLPIFQGGGDVNLDLWGGCALTGENLDLYSPRPSFPGYDLIAADLPPEVELLDLEALLLQAGRLAPEELQLIYNSPGMGHTVSEVMKDVSTGRNGG